MLPAFMVLWMNLLCSGFFNFMKQENITGKSFGHLTVISYFGIINKMGYWNCKCDCGKQKIVLGYSLTRGKSKTCGCQTWKKQKHRKSNSKEYSSWACMLQRCTNPNVKSYKDYGGRGIKVCKKWESFNEFYGDMGDMPEWADSIERKEVDGDYEKSNCVWESKLAQAQNKRNSRWLEYEGEKYVMAEWTRRLGVSHSAVYNLLKKKTFKEIVIYYKEKQKI